MRCSPTFQLHLQDNLGFPAATLRQVSSVFNRLLPAAIRLNLGRDGTEVILSWTVRQGPYQVQQTTTLGATNALENVGEPVQATSMRIPLGSGNVFLRVRGQ